MKLATAANPRKAPTMAKKKKRGPTAAERRQAAGRKAANTRRRKEKERQAERARRARARARSAKPKRNPMADRGAETVGALAGGVGSSYLAAAIGDAAIKKEKKETPPEKRGYLARYPEIIGGLAGVAVGLFGERVPAGPMVTGALTGLGLGFAAGSTALMTDKMRLEAKRKKDAEKKKKKEAEGAAGQEGLGRRKLQQRLALMEASRSQAAGAAERALPVRSDRGLGDLRRGPGNAAARSTLAPRRAAAGAM